MTRFHESHRLLTCLAGLLITLFLSWPGLASAQFADATSGPLGDTGPGMALAWGDYDNDGDLDLYIANYGQQNRLLRNDGSGVFVDATTPPLNAVGNTRAAAWADYDNDGDLDLYVTFFFQPNKLFRNDGGGLFTDASSGPLGLAANTVDAPWGDYDNDGNVDLYLVSGSSSRANKLFRNEGAGAFVDLPIIWPLALASTGMCAVWGDYDNDRDPDIFVVNSSDDSRLLRNDGAGSFSDATTSAFTFFYGQSAAWGDYDNDGDLDLYVLDGFGSKLLRNDGAGVFTDASNGPLGSPGNCIHAAWADYDNDGDLDLYVCNYGAPNMLIRNDGGVFVDATTSPLGDSGNAYAAAWGDYDNDGDLDLYLVNYGQSNKLFRNEAAAGKHWLQVKLRGVFSNGSGIGARVRVNSGGVTRVREISGGTGWASQDAMVASFGLGSSTSVGFAEVHWPSGIEQVIDPPPLPDQAITVLETGPAIFAVSDIPGDQGGWVRVGFSRVGNDWPGQDLPITTYYLWRRVESPSLAKAIVAGGRSVRPSADVKSAAGSGPPPALSDRQAGELASGGFVLLEHQGRVFASAASSRAGATSLPPGVWEVAGSAPAIQQPSYRIIAPTVADSSVASGVSWSAFLVTAHTATPTIWFRSDPDSGFSVDNLSPSAPVFLASRYGGGITRVRWRPNPEADFAWYRLHRGVTAEFVPGDDNLLTAQADTGYTDPAAAPWSYYKLAALDVQGNESAWALLPPQQIAAVPGGGTAAATWLLGANPNPFNPATTIGLNLAREGRVRLAVFDAAGRQVLLLIDEVRPAGPYEVRWDGRGSDGRSLASGVYFCRLQAGAVQETKRLTLVR